MQKSLAFFLVLVLAGPAFAWNEKGHYVVCRLAWLQMTEAQRAKVTEILKKHPHYTEYLTKNKPGGFSTDEWAFMRAGAWADWIRSGSARSYGHSTWHYINYPICFPGLGESEDKHQPPAGQENAVWAMNRCLEKIKNGTDEEKAVFLTWLCHLIGDIHQPLHCVALFSDKYPDGDRGGNAIRIRISSSPTNLHSFWDGLLGRGVTPGNIRKDVTEIQAAMKERAEAIKPDLAPTLTTPELWAMEGAQLARHAVYLNGELLKGRDDGEGVLQAPAEYAPACGRVARIQIGKAGKRLATALGNLLTPENLTLRQKYDRIKVGMNIEQTWQIAPDLQRSPVVLGSLGRIWWHAALERTWPFDILPPYGMSVWFLNDTVERKELEDVTLERTLRYWLRSPRQLPKSDPPHWPNASRPQSAHPG